MFEWIWPSETIRRPPDCTVAASRRADEREFKAILTPAVATVDCIIVEAVAWEELLDTLLRFILG